MSFLRYSLLVCFVFIVAPLARADDQQTEFSSEQIEFFEKKIRPIFVESCHECHGNEDPEAGLRLTSRDSILRGGDSGPAVVPGDLEAGELLLAVSYDPDGYQMPPDGKLPDETVQLLREWVRMGAPWPDEAEVSGAHEEFDLAARAARYSFQPLEENQPPVVGDASWPRMPIDCFLLARLEDAGLTPAPEVDRRTWIRRACFDTIGLPPTPEQVQAFLMDDAPGAYERAVDRLLASPHFGERWGRHWLDLVRYAESRGHEFDFDVPNPWHYRDYVVRALNDDVAYDQFVVEHVAGDLLSERHRHARQVANLSFLDGADSPRGSVLNSTTVQFADGTANTIAASNLGQWRGLVDGTSATWQLANRTPRVFDVRFRPDTDGNESILGTGFWFLGEWVHSPVDIRQEEADRFDNMIDVYSKTFLGLTVACARCHDHKFDPITQADFYALQGYLQSSAYRQARFESMDHNRRVAEQLDELRREATPVILEAFADAIEPTISQLERYLAAARDAITSAGEVASTSDDISFEDFESGTYEGWELTGDAFGDSPQTQDSIASYQNNVQAHGRFFVNSHQKRGGGRGDAHVGTMMSPEFRISRSHIRFLIGGGAHEGKTCVNLLVDGETAMSATGRNANAMAPVSWDVSEYLGKLARIQVVDNERGGWGNIGLDQIVFSNSVVSKSPSVTASELTPEFRRSLDEAADRLELDRKRLAHWAAHLLNAESDAEDPFHVVAQQHPAAFLRSEFDRARDQVQEVLRQLGDDVQNQGDPRVEILHNPVEQPEGWAPQTTLASDGRHFGTRAGQSGELVLSNDPGSPIARIIADATIRRERTWDGLQVSSDTMHDPGSISGWQRSGRVLRSRSFEITSGRVWCLIRGSCNTYVAVDSHVLIKGPLHGDLLRQHAASEESAEDGWRWIQHDVSRYQGHRAHLEIALRADEPLEISWVVQADRNPESFLGGNYGTKDAWWRPLRHLESELQDDQVLEAATTFFSDVLAICRGRRLHRMLPLAYYYQMANWLNEHPHLVGLDSAAAQNNLKQVAEPIFSRASELKTTIRDVSATAPCMLDGSGEDEYVFIRGAWKKRGETVPRRFLEVFNGQGPSALNPEVPTRQGSGRLDLALQMVDPKQTPILPRVVVNRIWQHYFGRGIVPTPDDFGHMGQEPSHPKLLDWLATELIRHDWSLKHIHRQILLSAAYRMASSVDRADAANSTDPENVLLHRMNVKRLEGEIIRDAVLSVSGRIDQTLYGKSVPVHLTSFMEGRGRPGQSGPVDGHGRRSIYIAVRRNFAEPFFQAFDFPNPHTTIGRRSVSNVPAQALALMNNPLIVQQSRVWAERLLADTPVATVSERVTQLYQTAFSRRPTEEELAAGTGFIEAQAAEYDTDANDVRVWSDYCHVLINVKDFVFIQ